MLKRAVLGALLAAMGTTTLLAMGDATVPTADRKGSKDHPLLKRYDGSFIVVAERKAFDEFALPTGPLAPVADKRDSHNNRVHEPKTKKALEGVHTRLAYVIPADRSPLEVLRNYQDEIKTRGGKILFECKGEECGGDPGRTSNGGGGDQSIAMYLYPEERITDQFGTTAYCALAERMKDQRYTTAELPESGAHVSVLSYTLVEANPRGACATLNNRTIAVVDIVEAKAREAKMVTVDAGAMAKAITGTGRVALYGIFFDFNKAEVKPESDPTLAEIGKLLKSTPAMKLLVVGHTDNVGGYASNLDLSQRRAASVVGALATRYGIAKDRLTPVGVSFASPVSSNGTEDGRAKNRRVELVEHATGAGS